MKLIYIDFIFYKLIIFLLNSNTNIFHLIPIYLYITKSISFII